ncbi:MAG: hypothetical protein LBH03_01515, partial [Holophagales bacterium]|nr:hypothetical protein [Holophagales bacterium]
MSELKVGIAFRLIDAITEPLQKLTERLGAVTKATKAVSGGMTGVGKASAQINKASSAIVKADAVTGEWNKTTSLLVDQFGNALPSVTAGVDKVGEAVDTVADKIALLGGMDNRAAGTQVAQLAQNAGVADFDALSKIVVGGAHASGTDIGETLASLTTLAKQGEGLGFKGADDLADISKLKAAFAIGGSENSEGAVSAILSNLPRLGEKMQHGKGWRVMDTAATMQKFGIGNLMDQAFDKEGNLLADESGSKMGNINKIIHAISTAKDAGGNAIGDKDKLNIFRELFDQNAAIDLAKMDLGLLNEATAKLLEQADVQAKVAAVTDTTASKF